VTSVLSAWGENVAGRFGFGYRWASGNQVSATVWGYETDTQVTGGAPDDAFLHLAIGPAIPQDSGYIGNQGDLGTYDFTTEIKAQTADVAWARELELGENFNMEWSVGLRYADFEETYAGDYDQVVGFDAESGPMGANKSNTGEMFGVRAAVRGTYKIVESFSIGGSLGFSMLDGELTSESTLTPTGTVGGQAVPANTFLVVDNGRSGTIRDFDLIGTWHIASDRYRLYFGWEQSRWEDVAADLARNLPGNTAPLRDRSDVVFSGYKLGFYFSF